MAKYYYPAKFTDEGNGFSVQFIDYDEIYTCGDDFEEAYYMAQDVLYCMLPDYVDEIKKPTLDYMKIPVKKNEFITMVYVDTIEHEKTISSKTVKTTVTMPEWLKNLADDANINFSKLLQESIKRELNLL